jgi:putative membrane protein
MRGRYFKIVSSGGGCFLGVCAVFAQTAAPPMRASMTPTSSPTAAATPAPTPSTTPPLPLNLPSAKATVDRMRSLDASFMTRVELRGMEEVELSRIAAERAANPDLRAFGQQIARDRGKANEELRLFAPSEAIELPTTLDASRRAEVNRVSRLSPPALDRALPLEMVRLHDADVADFQKQTRMGQEVELQGWVYETLPLLESQQEEIHRIAGVLRISPAAAR